jgi:hypothetical protein
VRNHDEKIKDISRSVLPSTGREFARGMRRAIHKRQRARELAAVTAYRRDADPESVTPDAWGTHGALALIGATRAYAPLTAAISSRRRRPSARCA